MNYVMKNIGGHIEVYDTDGNFCFSADNLSEASLEIYGM